MANLDEVVVAYLEAVEAGQTPDREQWLARYPDLAPQLSEFFADQESFGRLAEPLREAVSAVQDATIEEKLGEGDRPSDFRLIREIGRGGMGIVYEAEQISLGRRVALKVLPFAFTLDAKQLQRFKNEAHAAAQLHHTNIVPVHASGCERGVHYYTMPFIQGRSLQAVLRELRRLRSLTGETPVPPAGGEDGAGDELTANLARALLTGDFPAPEVFTDHDPESTVLDRAATPHRETGREGEVDLSPGLGVSVSPCLQPRSSNQASSSILDSRSSYCRRVAMIGLQIAEGLKYAHGQAVLHRDIKPSNLLLDTRGTVWITDFGLAKADGNDDLTLPGEILGTLRYMAPERFDGRADARSDLYSLGMTLYELLTLQPAFEDSNRARLIERITHEQPARLRKLNLNVPRDLETMILKAIAKEPARRFQTAAELAEDLERFLADRPIKARRSSMLEHAWRWCRRNPQIAALTASVAFLLVTIAVVSSLMAWWLGQERNATKEQLDLTQQAEREATWQRYNSLLAQARAWSGRVGQRFKTLQVIGDAAKLLPALKLGPEARKELRNQAIAAMALPDIRRLKEWEGKPLGKIQTTFDDNLEYYARTDDKGNISVHRVADDQEVAFLPGPRETKAYHPRFSPNGRYLAVKYHKPNLGDANQCLVWDWQRQEKVLSLPFPISGAAFDFSPDSQRFGVGRQDGNINIYDLTSKKMQSISLPKGMTAYLIAFHPDGRKLAVFYSNRIVVEIWDLNSIQPIQRFQEPGYIMDIAWHPEGKLLAVACAKDYAIHIWDTIAGKTPVILYKGHYAEPSGLKFNHRGNLLASNSWDATTRLWDPWSGHELLTSAQQTLQFSRDDRRMVIYSGGTKFGLWEVALPRECRRLPSFPEEDKGPSTVDFSPDGRFLASGHGNGIRLWDIAAGKEAAFLVSRSTPNSLTVIFDPEGKTLISTGINGVSRWPIKRAAGSGEWVEENRGSKIEDGEAKPSAPGVPPLASKFAQLVADLQVSNRTPFTIVDTGSPFGPPRLLGETSGCDIWRGSLSANGRILALADRTKMKAIILDLQNDSSLGGSRRGAKLLFDYLHPCIANIAVSPDGRWVASADWGNLSGIVHIYDVTTGKPVKDFIKPNTAAALAFSPDSKWLVVGAGDAYRFWEVGSWKAGLEVKRAESGTLPPFLAFSPDGNVLAITPWRTPSLQPIRLVDTSTGEELATLSVPRPEQVNWLCFGPDGSQLAAACAGHGTYLWDLRAIRQQLDEMGLDWELPP